MDKQYLLATVRYVEQNPVNARLSRNPENWPCSSVHANRNGHDVGIVAVKTMLEPIESQDQHLLQRIGKSETDAIRKNSKIGRPLGSSEFIKKLEELTGRELKRKNPGVKI